MIIQCEGCEGTSFEVHQDGDVITFVCKHCGEVWGGHSD